MITLRQIAATIRRELSGGDPSHDFQFGERTIIQKIKMHLNAMYKVERFQRWAAGDKTEHPLYIYTFPAITVDKTGKYATFQLQENTLDLPYNKGVYQICPDTDAHDPYIRRLNQGTSRHLPCGQLQGAVGWWQEGYDIFLAPKEKVKNKAIPKLLLIGPDAIGMDDPLPVGPDLLPTMMANIKNELIQTPPQDVLNDNNQDLIVQNG